MKAEVTEYQLRLSFHGRPAAPEVFEKISAPGFRAGIQPVLSLEVAAAPPFTLAVQAGLESAAPTLLFDRHRSLISTRHSAPQFPLHPYTCLQIGTISLSGL